MFIVEAVFSSEFEVKKSNFISIITPIEKFDSLHVKLKEKHPKANHIVWAKRYLNEYEQIVENCSDDGEPKGTSGPPVLNVMRGAELIECGILIVRYFGGTKLGTGGLVRAYGSSAKEVIAAAEILPYVKKENFKFFIEYHLVPRFEHYFTKNNFELNNREFVGEGVNWNIDLSEEEKENLLQFATVFEREGFKSLC